MVSRAADAPATAGAQAIDAETAVQPAIGGHESLDIVPEQLGAVCILLGPYRNLTTLTCAILGLHPRCVVLNHAGVRVLPNPDLNFLTDYSPDKFREFVRFVQSESRGGARGMHGGDIRLSHAFDREAMREALARADQLPHEPATCLVWKESHMVTNFLRSARVDVGELLRRNTKIRFLLPVRNPIDCALSNLATGHVQLFAESHGLSTESSEESVVDAVLDEIAWFFDLRERSGHADRFFGFFEHEMGRSTLERLLAFLGLPLEEGYLSAAAGAFRPSAQRRKHARIVGFYAQRVAEKFARHPWLRDALLKFAAPPTQAARVPAAGAAGAEVGRNAPCPCGSGKRYKDCHGAIDAGVRAKRLAHARALFARGNVDDVRQIAQRAVEANPADADAWTRLGLALETTEPDAALAAWHMALSIDPQKAEAHFRIGDFCRRRGDYPAAIAAYEAALTAGSTHPVLLNNLGLALQQDGRFADAEGCYRRALQQSPDLIEANANLADVQRLQHRYDDAVGSYARAVALDPRVASLWLNLGVCQHQRGDVASARTSFERALALKPDDAQAALNLATALNAELRYAEALPLIERVATREPDSAEATNVLLYTRQQVCDWRELDPLFESQRASLARADAPAIAPHNMLALPYSSAELLSAARKWVACNVNVEPLAPPSTPARIGGKLRIAYLGPDFRTHPLANLLTGVIELHDRSRFEVVGYSLGPDDSSPARARFAAGFDRFVDVRGESVQATARRIRDDGIAVLLDTSGYVLHARPQIFALRPAPVQVNCIGFAGTLGAAFYDYILADRVVAPPEEQAHFVERPLYLPHCYLPSDPGRIAGPVPSRGDCGLPGTGFVFCCFNSSYKILPPVFEVWMRALREVPGSVLWLLGTSPLATANLRREAESRGVAAERLVFAPRVPLSEHLARHSLADLFLDTLPCNAHTTANDALFAGLPVLTCTGETFASRVSASQLIAVGLPELVTHDLAAYEALALDLAREPDRLAAYRSKLLENRVTAPLFDTRDYTRALERLLEEACARWGMVRRNDA